MPTVSSASSSNSVPAKKDTTSVKAQTDQFLKILTTQLQNQNPLDPMKPAEFTSQLTQYSQLEQQLKFNEKLDTLINVSSQGPQISPLSYLNTTVDYYSDTAPLQEGKATWSYVTSGAANVSIRIEDSTGATVYTGAGDISSGAHKFELPNTTLAAGTPLRMIVTATDAAGKSVQSTINARAKINAVNTIDGRTILEASGFFLSPDNVTRVAS
jgi:flagellar basal-body rod modification protein FlgD